MLSTIKLNQELVIPIKSLDDFTKIKNGQLMIVNREANGVRDSMIGFSSMAPMELPSNIVRFGMQNYFSSNGEIKMNLAMPKQYIELYNSIKRLYTGEKLGKEFRYHEGRSSFIVNFENNENPKTKIYTIKSRKRFF